MIHLQNFYKSSILTINNLQFNYTLMCLKSIFGGQKLRCEVFCFWVAINRRPYNQIINPPNKRDARVLKYLSSLHTESYSWHRRTFEWFALYLLFQLYRLLLHAI